jgi:hypothetical protein
MRAESTTGSSFSPRRHIGLGLTVFVVTAALLLGAVAILSRQDRSRAATATAAPAQERQPSALQVPAAATATASDPALQGVMGYLRAHGVGKPRPAPWEPMVQAVLDYLRAHGVELDEH